MNDVFLFSLVSSPILSFAVTFGTIFWLINYSKLRIPDYPNHRSLHTRSVQRIGGIGLIAGIIVAAIVSPAIISWSVWFGIFILIVVSLVDDIFSLPFWLKLFVHGLVAIFTSVSIFFGMYSWVILIVSLLIVWMINLYNFMDGSDGLAGGMALFGFSFYGLAAFLDGNDSLATLSFSISSAALAFLYFNFYPARVFMGDAGSIPLGYLAAVLGILGYIESIWPVWFPFLVFSPFIVDASTTLVKRILQGKKIWQAHREHYYQRLIVGGLGHRNTALIWYVLMFFVGISSVWATQQEANIQFVVGMGWSIVYLGLIIICEHYWKENKHNGA